jgi:putative acetyltransferase
MTNFISGCRKAADSPVFFKEFLIRPASNPDIPFVQRVVFTCLEEYGLKPDLTGKDSDLQDIEKNYFSNNGYFGVTANSNTNAIVGTFGLFSFAPEICELRKMYLMKDYRGKGLGKYMLGTAIGIAKSKNYKKIFLETISPLTEAISLYRLYGFSEIEPREINSRVDRAFTLDI